jgi:hypothetical protein
MVRQRCIPLDEPAAWRAALQRVRHAFAHTWESCYAMHLTTGYPTYLYQFEAEGVRIVCPIAERPHGEYTDIVTPYGFAGFVGTGDHVSFLDSWSSFARQRGYVCGYIGLNPLLEHTVQFKAEELYEYNCVYVLDLTLSNAELFANLSTSRKQQLRDWETKLPSFVVQKSTVSSFFIDSYHDFFRSRHAAPVYNFSPATLSFLADLENVFIVGTHVGAKVVAASVFAHTIDVGEYLFNISLPEGRSHAAALLWYGAHHLKSQAIPLLNLGGGIRANDGVAQFKRRFGAKRMPLRCLKQVYNPALYSELCERAGVDPADRAGYFPAYRKR